jgi:hypothetical protein
MTKICKNSKTDGTTTWKFPDKIEERRRRSHATGVDDRLRVDRTLFERCRSPEVAIDD